jgi:hypothetical protein
MAQFISHKATLFIIGTFTFTVYVHFYSVDTIPSYPVWSLRPLRMFLRIYQRFTACFVLECYCPRHTYEPAARNRGIASLGQRHFLLEGDKKTVKSCLLTAKQTFGTYSTQKHSARVMYSALQHSVSEKSIKWRPVHHV